MMRSFLEYSVIPYAFAIGWLFDRYYSPSNSIPANALAQAFKGFIDSVPLGALHCVTLLTPAIILLALLRTNNLRLVVILGIALLACCVGGELGSTAPQVFNKLTDIVVAFLFNAPLLAIWSVAIVVLFRRAKFS